MGRRGKGTTIMIILSKCASKKSNDNNEMLKDKKEIAIDIMRK